MFFAEDHHLVVRHYLRFAIYQQSLSRTDDTADIGIFGQLHIAYLVVRDTTPFFGNKYHYLGVCARQVVIFSTLASSNI